MDLFAKNLHAENVYTDHGYFGDLTASSTLTAGQRLCVNDDAGTPVCVTGTQLRSLLNGSVLGSHTESAANENADAPGVASGAPASSAEESADAASSTTAIDTNSPTPVVNETVSATSTPPAANDNQPTSSEPAAANDNSPVAPLAAIGTDASPTAQ